jgi:hypothetical protein
MIKWIKKKQKSILKNAGHKRLIYLPDDFAEIVIDLELKCQRPDAKKKDVSQLMGLYTVRSELFFNPL